MWSLSACLFVCLPVNLSVCLSACLFVCLPAYHLFVCLPVCLCASLIHTPPTQLPLSGQAETLASVQRNCETISAAVLAEARHFYEVSSPCLTVSDCVFVGLALTRLPLRCRYSVDRTRATTFLWPCMSTFKPRSPSTRRFVQSASDLCVLGSFCLI